MEKEKEEGSLAFDLEAVLRVDEEVFGQSPIPQMVTATPVDDMSTLDNDTIGGNGHGMVNRFGEGVPFIPVRQEYEASNLIASNEDLTTPKKSNARVAPTNQDFQAVPPNKQAPNNGDVRNGRSKRIYILAILVGPILIALICGLVFGLVRLREDKSESQSASRDSLPTPTPVRPPIDGGGDDTPISVPSSNPIGEPTRLPNESSTIPQGYPTTAPVHSNPASVPANGPGSPSVPVVPSSSPTGLPGEISAPSESEEEAPSGPPPTAPVSRPSNFPAPPNGPFSVPTPRPTSPTRRPVAPTPHHILPTRKPTAKPTSQPIPRPTEMPTRKPTARPTPRPTPRLTPQPTDRLTPKPTPKTTPSPTMRPTDRPTARPIAKPTVAPTPRPVSPTQPPILLTLPPSPAEPWEQPIPTPPISNPTDAPVQMTPTPVPPSASPASPNHPPMAPVSVGEIRYPDFRYVVWQDADQATRERATVLGYHKNTWNFPGTKDIEWLSYETIQLTLPGEIAAAMEDLGFTGASWDCWVNHYYDYDWPELEQRGLSDAFVALGWDLETWHSDNENSWPDSESKLWMDLTGEERIAAGRLCYTQELWNKIPIPAWATIEEARKDFLIIIASRSFESLEIILEDIDSPQHRAFAWITNDPAYFGYGKDRVLQRWVLSVFALGLTDVPTEYSAKASILDSWVRETDECTWFSSQPSSLCNPDGLYERIDIRDANLYGTLPSELSLLSHSLEWIFLPGNNIFGTVPTQIGELTLLKRLQLTTNLLEGTIPTEFGRMTKLAVLGVGRNTLTGTLPTEIGNLPELHTVGLERNRFFGTIPSEFGNMINLAWIYMDRNLLTGTVPASLEHLEGLQGLNLGYNNFVGSVPEGVCQLEDLHTFIADCYEIDCPCCTECTSG